LVLDGRPPADLAEGEHDGVEVRYARRRGRDAADDRIVELVEADSDPRSLRVVTSDRDLVDRVTALGATTEGAGAFLRRLDTLGA
jgi:predicted RNA-binding protein with PIN domain